MLQRAVGFFRVGTVHAFLISSLANAPDRSQGPIEDPDDVSKRDLRWQFDEGITSLDAPGAGHKARMLETQQNLLEKDHRNVLALSDLLPRDRMTIVLGQLDQRAEPVFAFLREFHRLMFTKSVNKLYISGVPCQVPCSAMVKSC